MEILWGFIRIPRDRVPHSSRAGWRLGWGFSQRHSHRELDLPRSVSTRGLHEIRWYLVISGKVFDSNVLNSIIESGGVAHGTVISKLKSPVQPVEQVERLSAEVQ